MAKTSIHFKPAKVGSVEAHNERSQEYLDGVRKSGREFYFFPDLTHLNQSLVNPKYEDMTCEELFEKQQKLYFDKFGQKPNLKDRVVKNQKTGKERLISGWSPIREGVCPIKEDTKLEDFMPFIKWCEDNGLNLIRIDLHFDEGYETIKGLRTFNRHAHIVVDWLDWKTCKTAKLDASKMSEAQDVIADALGMERGEKKVDSGRIHLNPAEFREKKAEEKAAELEEENQILKEENQELKRENDTLRNTNTGLSAKIMDAWKFKGRAEKAEASLETEKSSRIEDNAKNDQLVAKLQEELEIEKKKVVEERKIRFDKDKEYNSEIERLKGIIRQKNSQIKDLTVTVGKETSQGQDKVKTFKR